MVAGQLGSVVGVDPVKPPSGHVWRRALEFERSWIILHQTGWAMETRGIRGALDGNYRIFSLLDGAFSLFLAQYSWCRIIVHSNLQVPLPLSQSQPTQAVSPSPINDSQPFTNSNKISQRVTPVLTFGLDTASSLGVVGERTTGHTYGQVRHSNNKVYFPRLHKHHTVALFSGSRETARLKYRRPPLDTLPIRPQPKKKKAGGPPNPSLSFRASSH